MAIYNYECPKCGDKFESIEKIGTEIISCKSCDYIAKRIHGCDIPAPPVLYGEGFYKQSKRKDVE